MTKVYDNRIMTLNDAEKCYEYQCKKFIFTYMNNGENFGHVTHVFDSEREMEEFIDRLRYIPENIAFGNECMIFDEITDLEQHYMYEITSL